jgi:uncharacterized repeat protein (TIGR03803 family)
MMKTGIFIAGLLGITPLFAASETVIFNFTSESVTGGAPSSSLLRAASGTIYGIYSFGGASVPACYGFPCGGVFKISPSGTEEVIHLFNGSDGLSPSSLVPGGKILYGTTAAGGAYNYGTVFQMTPPAQAGGQWTESLLYSFSGPDGCEPISLVYAGGALYGTTAASPWNPGVVFKLAPPASAGGSWTMTTLHTFTGADGASPNGLVARNGVLYGVSWGPPGTIWRIHTDGSGFQVLHSFSGSDGQWPLGTVHVDAAGTLYGTCSAGGAGNHGNVFSLNASGAYSVLYSFTGGGDGGVPQAGVKMSQDGTLYGTTTYGGAAGMGVVFQLKQSSPPSWTENVLHSFSGPDGANPMGGVVQGPGSQLFGTTYRGGTNMLGVVYQIN